MDISPKFNMSFLIEALTKLPQPPANHPSGIDYNMLSFTLSNLDSFTPELFQIISQDDGVNYIVQHLAPGTHRTISEKLVARDKLAFISIPKDPIEFGLLYGHRYIIKYPRNSL